MPTGSNSVLPQQVSDVFLGDMVVQLSCGSFHSLLLTSAGEVFSWGSNGSGQLGHPQTSELVRIAVHTCTCTCTHVYCYHVNRIQCRVFMWFENEIRLLVFFLDSAEEGPL